MRRTQRFAIDIRELSNRKVKKVMEAQQRACQKICKDIQKSAPVNTGAYRDSIKVSKTFIHYNRIVTNIFSNLTLGGDNPTWQKFPLALIIEHGTKPHFITPKTPEGVLRWEDENGVHFAKLVWHPGTVANPHWEKALNRNREYYNKMIRKATGRRR